CLLEPTGEAPAGLTASPRDESVRLADKMAVLHDAVAQELVFSGEQILHQNVAALVHVTHCAREMMIDSRPSRTTEIICDRENLVRGFALAEEPLGIRAGRADRK